jgi:hypothetical protein
MICFWHTHPFTSLGFETGDISEVVLNLNMESVLTYPRKLGTRFKSNILQLTKIERGIYICGEETR